MKTPVLSCFALPTLLSTIVIASSAHSEAPYATEWTRQIGTSDREINYSVAVDFSGNAYISGYTEGERAQANIGERDAYLAKFDSNGTQLWTRQIGTTGDDYGFTVAIDAAGNAYLTGSTEGSLAGANAGINDVYLIKFTPDGTELWTRQIGSSRNEHSFSVAVDGAGNPFITGRTLGNLGGDNAGAYDPFLTKFSPSGMELWTRQFGTSRSDLAYSVAVDGGGNAYITGWTDGSLEGVNAGQEDAYLAKFNPDGTEQWTRQIGSSSNERSYSVDVDAQGNAFISGWTRGVLGTASAGSNDAFLTKFSPDGTKLWTHQFGTNRLDESYSVAIDDAGNAFVSGRTMGNLAGLNAGGSDTFLAKFDPTGVEIWTQQIGTEATDWSNSVAVDNNGNVYISGETFGSLGSPNAGSGDAFFIKFTPVPEPSSLLLVGLLLAVSSARHNYRG